MKFKPSTVFLAVMAVVLLATSLPEMAFAHGERQQEPFLRMRTVQWYDTQFPTNRDFEVNDTFEMSGKFRLHADWPQVLERPGDVPVFINVATPGPKVAREALYINGQASPLSTFLELGKDYDYRVVMKARTPGRHHVHPMLSVKGSGGIVGPGMWVNVTGDQADFRSSTVTMTGEEIENLETYNVGTVVGWHSLWIAIAAFWLLWWISRPLLIPRYLMVQNREWDRLITPLDRKVSAGLLVLTLVLVGGGYFWYDAKYPNTIPLQGGKILINSPPQAESPIEAISQRAEYYVPGRTLSVELRVTNNSDNPVQLGEFSTANLRFVNQDVATAVEGVPENYPTDYIAPEGLDVSDNSPIQPGETRVMTITASDVAWERERLIGLVEGPDNSYGGLLFFFDANGDRFLTSIGGPILPRFIEPATS